MALHPLLRRQLQRLGLDPATTPPPSAAWGALLERVGRTYTRHARAQRLSRARLSSLLSLSADWIWEQDAELRFTYVSDGFRAAVGLAPRLLGQRRSFGGALEAEPEALAEYERCVAARAPFRDFTYSLVRPDGVTRWVRVSGEPVLDEQGRFAGYRGIGRDVTDLVATQQRVQLLASHDTLTGLPGRRHFMAELDRAVARAQRTGSPLALFFIDLDGFKTINDTLGHACGDELLVASAQRLAGALRAADRVARLGGDEFVVLLEDAGSAADLRTVAEKVLAALAQPLRLADEEVVVTCSLGIACCPGDADSGPALLKCADAAMYRAKRDGKNAASFYTADLADSAARQFALESELRLALARGELRLHYQPKVDLAGGRLAGVEALLRWQHPRRGLVPPAEFIGLLEERGLIVPIGRWVIDEACRQIAAWRAQGLEPPPVAINVSARQFGSEALAEDLATAMARHGVAAGGLAIELTESALMADPQRAQRVLQTLRNRGIGIAIDDFGTGYSSLSYLKRFPAHWVKIDRSFVRGLPGDRDDTAITTAVIGMAHSLGLGVVAEGVEKPEQLALLARLGCDQAQGYLLGRPMPAEELAHRLTPLRRAA